MAQLVRQTLPQGWSPLVGSLKTTVALVSGHTSDLACTQGRCGVTFPPADFALGLGACSPRGADKMAGGDGGSNCCSRIEGHPPRLRQRKVVEEEKVRHKFAWILSAGLGLFSPTLPIYQHF